MLLLKIAIFHKDGHHIQVVIFWVNLNYWWHKCMKYTWLLLKILNQCTNLKKNCILQKLKSKIFSNFLSQFWTLRDIKPFEQMIKWYIVINIRQLPRPMLSISTPNRQSPCRLRQSPPSVDNLWPNPQSSFASQSCLLI